MYRSLVYPPLRRVDAEATHHVTLTALRAVQRVRPALALLRHIYAVDDPRLRVRAFGLDFANPVGLAAGFDKDAVALDGLAALGFGHLEAGTITPRPQAGRPRPRLFRLTEDDALINRLGFPNDGMQAARGRLAAAARRHYVLGVNVGPNAASVAAGTAAADYVAVMETLGPLADYVTINVSSPNTQGLRLLQAGRHLDGLLGAVCSARGRTAVRRPLLVKLAPDLLHEELVEFLQIITAHPIAGVIATNTTVDRPRPLRGVARQETGGLSGRPLRDRSTRLIQAIYRLTEGQIPIIGVGGVFTAADVVEKLRAGATLVQLYTGLVYEGPAVVRAINLGLLAHLQAQGLRSVQELAGKG